MKFKRVQHNELMFRRAVVRRKSDRSVCKRTKRFGTELLTIESKTRASLISFSSIECIRE